MLVMFFSVFKQIALMLLFVFFGYFVMRVGKAPNDASKIFSKVEKNFVLPIYLFLSLMNNFTFEKLKENLRLVIIGIVLVILAVIIGTACSFIVCKTPKNRNVFWYAFTLSNYGYFGYPLIEAVFGAEVKAIMVMIAIPYMIFNYSIAVRILEGKREKTKHKVNIPMTLVGLFFGILAGLFMSSKAKDITNGLLIGISSCMSPMAMVLLGMSLGSLPFKKIFTSSKSYLVSFIRLLVIPYLVFLVAHLVGLRGYELLIVTLLPAMPVGMNIVVFYKGEEKDRYVGAQSCFLSVILCLLTIPFVAMIVTQVFGIV